MQLLRFSIVGVMNTTVDILAFNLLMLGFPTHHVMQLVVYNSLAFALGACNSYLLNKYWTFRQRKKVTRGEIMRFVTVSLCSIACNNLLLWLIARITHPFVGDIILWANIAKIVAISGTFTLSYLGMHLWVFAGATQRILFYHGNRVLKQPIVVTDKS